MLIRIGLKCIGNRTAFLSKSSLLYSKRLISQTYSFCQFKSNTWFLQPYGRKLFEKTPSFSHKLFHTSQRRLLPPWLFIVVGRSARKIYKKLPLSFQNQISRYKIVFTGCIGVTGVISYYSYKHYDTCPLTGRKRWISFTRDQVVTLADLKHNEITKSYNSLFLSKDESLYQICNEFLSSLIRQNSDIDIVKNIDWNLNVIADETICNAFVLPNGQIYVFTGMIKLMDDWEELAVVLSHEMAHAILGHAQEQQSVMVFGKLSFVPFLFEDISAFFAKVIQSCLFPFLFEIGFSLPCNRLLEAEADEVGLRLLTKACYDPRWAVLFWEKMSYKETFDNLFSNQEDLSSIEFLSTHPTNDERALTLEKLIPELLEARKKFGCKELSSFSPNTNAHLFRKLKTIIREHDSIVQEDNEISESEENFKAYAELDERYEQLSYDFDSAIKENTESDCLELLDYTKKYFEPPRIRENFSMIEEISELSESTDLEKEEDSKVTETIAELKETFERLTSDFDSTVEEPCKFIENACDSFGYLTKFYKFPQNVSNSGDKALKVVTNDFLSPYPESYKYKKERDYYSSVYS